MDAMIMDGSDGPGGSEPLNMGVIFKILKVNLIFLIFSSGHHGSSRHYASNYTRKKSYGENKLQFP